MPRRLIPAAILVALLIATPVAGASAGWLDPRYGTNGSVDIRAGGTETRIDAAGIARSPRGTVVLSNVTLPSGPEGPRSGFRLDARTNAGAVDRGFNAGAPVRRSFADVGRAIGLVARASGPIVAGYEDVAGVVRLVGIAYRWDGALDTTYGDGGRWASPYWIEPASPGGRAALAHTHVTLLSDGRLRLCTTVVDPAADRGVWLVGATTDGEPDPAVGRGGIRRLDLGAASSCNGIVVDTGDRLVVAGTGRVEGRRAAIVGRFTADGEVDGTFGSGGHATVQWAAREFTASALVRLGSSGYLVGGQAIDAGAPPLAYTARLTAAGGTDATYGYGGVYRYPGGSGGSVLRSLDPSGNGRLLAGIARLDRAGTTETLARLLATTGRLDGAFGNGGSVVVLHRPVDTTVDPTAGTVTAGTRVGLTTSVLVQRRLP